MDQSVPMRCSVDKIKKKQHGPLCTSEAGLLDVYNRRSFRNEEQGTSNVFLATGGIS